MLKINNENNQKIVHSLKNKSYEILSNFDRISLNAVEINKSLLRNIIASNKSCEYGKKWNFSEINDIDSFKTNIPFTTYEDYYDAIIRMMENHEENIITSNPVVYFADTSGTTGNIKKIPVSDKSLELFRDYASAVMPAIISEYYNNTKNKDCPDGYRLMLLHFKNQELDSGAKFGCISAACLRPEDIKNMSYFVSTPSDVMFCDQKMNLDYFHALFALARKDIVYISGSYMSVLLDFANYVVDNWRMLIDDIRDGKINENIVVPDDLRKSVQKKLRPNPKRAKELENEFIKGLNNNIFIRIWPNLSAVCAIWAGCFNSFAYKMQKFTGRSIPYYTMSYTMSEGVVGIARHPFDQYYVLTPDSCFFEFIEYDEYADDEDYLSKNTLLIDEIEDGKEYEMIITNQSGFYRYLTGDVVKVVGFYNESPMIEFKLRKKNIMSLVGEVFTEEHLAAAIQGFIDKTGINIKDYCVYPNRNTKPPRYEVYIEPKDNFNFKNIKYYEEIINNELNKACTDFKDFNIGFTKLRILQKNSFQNYRDYKIVQKNVSRTQIKPIRVIDNLEQLNFFKSLEDNE